MILPPMLVTNSLFVYIKHQLLHETFTVSKVSLMDQNKAIIKNISVQIGDKGGVTVDNTLSEAAANMTFYEYVAPNQYCYLQTLILQRDDAVHSAVWGRQPDLCSLHQRALGGEHHTGCCPGPLQI